MKNIMKNNTISNTFLKAGILLPMLLAVLIIMPHAAHAQFDDSGDFSGDCCGYGSSSTGTDYSAPADYGSYSTGTDYTYPADYGSYSLGTDTTYPADFGSDSLGTDTIYPASFEDTTGYIPSSYLTGSSFLGSSYLPGPSFIGSTPVSSGSQIQTQSQSQAQVSNNTNTNVNNNVVTVNVPQQPVVYQNTPSYPVCNTCGCPGYAACYQQPVYPIAYNQTPYISLSEAPYTGLDLGFWGTIAYWGFLVLWCLVAAYLVVVKKVQNRILRSLNTFLFGDYTEASHEVAVAAPVATVHSYSAPAPVATHGDAIDPFIVSQINRVRA